MDTTTKLEKFFLDVEQISSDDFMKLAQKHLTEEDMDTIANHIERFYDVHDDDDVEMLTQMMVTAYLAAKI